jgi:LAO/AO transport system kinase
MMLDLTHHTLPKTVLHHGLLMDAVVAGSDKNLGAEAGWRPPICQTIATQGQGIDEVVQALAEHRTYQQASGVLVRRERERLIFEIQQLLKERLLADLLATTPPEQINATLEQVVARQLDPYAAIERLMMKDKPPT